jgi:hypothetical protein
VWGTGMPRPGTKRGPASLFAAFYASVIGSVRAQKVHAFIDKIELLATDVVRLNVELAEGCWLDLDFEQVSERSEN